MGHQAKKRGPHRRTGKKKGQHWRKDKAPRCAVCARRPTSSWYHPLCKVCYEKWSG